MLQPPDHPLLAAVVVVALPNETLEQALDVVQGSRLMFVEVARLLSLWRDIHPSLIHYLMVPNPPRRVPKDRQAGLSCEPIHILLDTYKADDNDRLAFLPSLRAGPFCFFHDVRLEFHHGASLSARVTSVTCCGCSIAYPLPTGNASRGFQVRCWFDEHPISCQSEQTRKNNSLDWLDSRATRGVAGACCDGTMFNHDASLVQLPRHRGSTVRRSVNAFEEEEDEIPGTC